MRKFFLLASLLAANLCAEAHAESECARNCSDSFQSCRQDAENKASMEQGFMPLDGHVHPEPNANPLPARRAYQAEVQKRKMEQQLQCEAQKNRCMSSCAAADNTAAKHSVIFK